VEAYLTAPVLELFGVHEMHRFFGVTKQAIQGWRKNDPLFPDPVAELACGPVWTRDQVENFRKARSGNVGRIKPEVARSALELCKSTFEFYAKQHREKASGEHLSPQKITETLEKAEVNEDLVRMLDAVLRGEIPEKLNV
jgi:hypothetical protein